MNLDQYKAVFDTQTLPAWRESTCVPDTLAHLWNPLWPIVQGGKRIRGYLAEVGLGALTGASQLGLALEVLHAFALVHDDIMDQATTRRGHPTVHTALGEQVHTGASYAILLGDWLLVESYNALEQCIEQRALAQPIARDLRQSFRALLQEMVFGQMMDISLELDRTLPLAYITHKTQLKTALYTFARPLMLGLQAQSAPPETVQWALDWGTAVGLGFQVQDDLLDLVGDAQTLGKNTLTDIAEDSGTFFRWWVLHNGTASEQALLNHALGRADLTQAEQTDLVHMFYTSGAVAAGQARIAEYYAQGHALLVNCPLNNDQQACLTQVLTALTHRTA